MPQSRYFNYGRIQLIRVLLAPIQTAIKPKLMKFNIQLFQMNQFYYFISYFIISMLSLYSYYYSYSFFS